MTLAIHEDNHGGLVLHQSPPAAQVAVAQNDMVAQLAQWAQAAKAAHSMAVSLVETSFVPAQFRGKPHEATAAILSGAEMGLSPMAALRSFDIIQGTAAARAVTLRAVVQSHGHDIWEAEATETRAVVRGRRKGSDKVRESRWTIERAQKLGLTGKDNWKKQPGAMLLARATAECARLVASDAILGIPYSSEEISDGIYGDEAIDVVEAPAEAPKRRAQRKPVEKATAAEPEPEPVRAAVEPEPVANGLSNQGGMAGSQPEPPLDADGSAEMSTADQRKHMFALWRDLGFDGEANRDNRLTIATKVLGLPEPLRSTSDLTYAEMETLIAALRDRKAKQGDA